jgi:hypothetical protein
VQEYISAFNNLKAQYKAAGRELGTTEATFLNQGLITGDKSKVDIVNHCFKKLLVITAPKIYNAKRA